MIFINDWGARNKKVILNALSIQKPEFSKVLKIEIIGDGFEISFLPAPGKYWSLAFCEAIFKYNKFPFGQFIDINEELKNYTASCFSGIPSHFGFISAFENGYSICVTMKKGE